MRQSNTNTVMSEAEKQKVPVRDLTGVKYVLSDENTRHELILKLRAKQQLRRIKGRNFPRCF